MSKYVTNKKSVTFKGKDRNEIVGRTVRMWLKNPTGPTFNGIQVSIAAMTDDGFITVEDKNKTYFFHLQHAIIQVIDTEEDHKACEVNNIEEVEVVEDDVFEDLPEPKHETDFGEKENHSIGVKSKLKSAADILKQAKSKQKKSRIQ